jgi:flagellar basal-body rod protein FlgG
MGQNGPIQLADNEFIVNEEGMIIQGENVVDTLLIRCFEDASTLRKIGTNTLAETEQSQEQQFNGKVLQGFLEQSNVNVISEMVDMITVLRAYEANQKILQIQDDALGKAVNEVGMIR